MSIQPCPNCNPNGEIIEICSWCQTQTCHPCDESKKISELEELINFLAGLKSALWDRPRNGHGWRLLETDVGAMHLLAEADTPVECVRKAKENYGPQK